MGTDRQSLDTGGGADLTIRSVTEKISSIALQRKTPLSWYLSFALAFTFLMLLLVSVAYLFQKGVGIWGINVPVAWGFAIINFVWWIGIGHACTWAVRGWATG